MPAYNAGMYITEAIESIRAQSISNWELVIIDDGSIDETVGILDRYQSLDPRIRVSHIQHCGIAGALNKGLEQCRAPIVARMDADDRSAATRLEKQVCFLNEHPSVGVVSCHTKIFADENVGAGLQLYVDWVNSLSRGNKLEKMRFIDAPVVHPSVCFRHQLVDVFGGYRQGGFPEDYELWLRWMDHDVSFATLNESLFQWRDHSRKLTRTDERYSESAMWRLKARYFDRWLSSNTPANRPLIIWGSGRKTRKRLNYFEFFNSREIEGFIDIDPKKIGQRIDGIPVFLPAYLERETRAFVIAMVGSRGARYEIETYMESLGNWTLGEDYLFLN